MTSFYGATSRLFQLAELVQKGELPRVPFGKSGLQVKKKIEKLTVVSSRS